MQSTIKSSGIVDRETSAQTWLILLFLLAALYGTWLTVFWPGVLGEDSLAILLEVESATSFPSGKPNFWYYFVKTFYESLRLVELPVMAQMGLCALIFSRILAWCWCQGLRKTSIFLFVFIAAAPHVIYFIGLLNSDSLFAVGTAGLLFEMWLVSRAKRVSPASFAMIAISLPLAVFFRTNGIVSLIPIVVIGFALAWPERLKLLAISAFWLILMLVAHKAHPKYKHEVLFPLAAFETANFLQPRAMHLRGPLSRVSEKTIQILTTFDPIQKTIEYFDRDYWDPLVYFPDGPGLLRIESHLRSQFIREFFTYNLWHNLPSFAGSRVNVFMASVMAEGGFANLQDAAGVINRSKSRSEFRAFHLNGLEEFLKAVHAFSYNLRWVLWTPLLGIIMLFYVARVSFKEKDAAVLSITVPMILQLGGIFFFSIASEYRYLLPYFVLPMVLLPILYSEKLKAVAAR